MGLQYGRDKCVKMHVGKKQSEVKCVDVSVDAWDEKVVEESNEYKIIDEHIGKETMKNVSVKKYLGDIVSQDLKNKINIKEKTGKAVGNVN